MTAISRTHGHTDEQQAGGIDPTRYALHLTAGGKSRSKTVLLPFPSESKLNDRGQPLDEVRNVFCACYETCLDVAVKKNWRSWTCGACPLLAEQSQKPTAEKFANRRIREDWV